MLPLVFIIFIHLRKTKLHSEIEEVTQNINELNNLVREKEQDIKTLDGTHKQLNSEEEDYIQVITTKIDYNTLMKFLQYCNKD
jgi:uncharacterized coiled-coil DUF342 family protein